MNPVETLRNRESDQSIKRSAEVRPVGVAGLYPPRPDRWRRTRRLIDEDGLRGMTSNPAIFEKAIADSTLYDELDELSPPEKGSTRHCRNSKL